MTRRAALLVTAAALAAPATAHAESGSLADLGLAFTTGAPASPTGLTAHLAFHQPGDPNAKPPAIRSAVLHLPPGTRFDSTAVPQCTASDAELSMLGADACPADSELTVGKLTADTGFGAPVDPLAGDDHVFNGPGQIIEVITAPGTPLSPGFDRLTIDGSTVTAHPPATPGGPPDGQTAVRSIDFAFPARGALVTTPPACPDGTWTTTGTFAFADGRTDTVTARVGCEVPRVAAAACRRTSAHNRRTTHRRGSSSRRTRRASRGAAGARGRATSAAARGARTTAACRA